MNNSRAFATVCASCGKEIPNNISHMYIDCWICDDCLSDEDIDDGVLDNLLNNKCEICFVSIDPGEIMCEDCAKTQGCI